MGLYHVSRNAIIKRSCPNAIGQDPKRRPFRFASGIVSDISRGSRMPLVVCLPEPPTTHLRFPTWSTCTAVTTGSSRITCREKLRRCHLASCPFPIPIIPPSLANTDYMVEHAVLNLEIIFTGITFISEIGEISLWNVSVFDCLDFFFYRLLHYIFK